MMQKFFELLMAALGAYMLIHAVEKAEGEERIAYTFLGLLTLVCTGFTIFFH